ncbi:MAG: cyclic pyranopterin monophosphate synthase MoaC [Alphaproteobacteria bacterium]|nr:cyclic pyranopterin monophosphate synthase MoaC [Alphaproteobacteria bacterium]
MSKGHFDNEGRAIMVDVSAKSANKRIAVASGKLFCNQEAFNHAQQGTAKKGNVVQVAEIAAIMGAKQTSALIPLCHNLPLQSVKIRIDCHETAQDGMIKGGMIKVVGEAITHAETGVEMEALTAVSIACLTLYDMLKAYDKAMQITDIQLEQKSGGKSGDYQRHA